jgi:hypothetical protein
MQDEFKAKLANLLEEYNVEIWVQDYGESILFCTEGDYKYGDHMQDRIHFYVSSIARSESFK